MTVYRSKIDLCMWILISGIFVACFALEIITIIQEYQSLSIFATIMTLCSLLIPTVLIINVLRNTYYTIDDNSRTLLVKSGFIYNHINNIDKITLVKKTNSLLSSPALSTDRLEIRFGKFSRVVISPNDKDVFIEHLKRLNPYFETKL